MQKTVCIFLTILFSFLFFSSKVAAASMGGGGGGNGGGNGMGMGNPPCGVGSHPPCPDPVPIDGGILILSAIGIILGVRMVLRKKNIADH